MVFISSGSFGASRARLFQIFLLRHVAIAIDANYCWPDEKARMSSLTMVVLMQITAELILAYIDPKYLDQQRFNL
jgi:hypothetical protein